MIAYRIQEEAFGGLDRKTVKLLDRLARGEKPNELNRRLKPGTVLVREYRGERHTVTVVPDGFALAGDDLFKPVDHRQGHHRNGVERPALFWVARARRAAS